MISNFCYKSILTKYQYKIIFAFCQAGDQLATREILPFNLYLDFNNLEKINGNSK